MLSTRALALIAQTPLNKSTIISSITFLSIIFGCLPNVTDIEQPDKEGEMVLAGRQDLVHDNIEASNQISFANTLPPPLNFVNSPNPVSD